MKTLAILGGTGNEGAGLSMRWALKGYQRYHRFAS